MKKTKVLLIEDNNYINEIFKKELDKVDCTMLYADTGKKALESIKENKPEIVLLDLILPDMHGLEILKVIKKTSPKTKVMIISNISSEAVIKEAMELGTKDYFIKSNIDFFKIIEMLNSYIEEIKK